MSGSRRNSLTRRGSLRSGSIQHSGSELDMLKSLQVSPIKIEMKTVDMDAQMQIDVERVVADAVESCTSEKDIAAHIRRDMDKQFNKTWNVVVGQHFGSDVTHEAKRYAQLQCGQLHILVWKSG